MYYLRTHEETQEDCAACKGLYTEKDKAITGSQVKANQLSKPVMVFDWDGKHIQTSHPIKKL